MIGRDCSVAIPTDDSRISLWALTGYVLREVCRSNFLVAKGAQFHL